MNVTVGHTVTNTIGYLDTNGNPMLVTPTPDSPPVWTDAPVPAGCDTNVVSPDGLTDVVTAVAPGVDTVGVTVLVGGKAFTATVSVNITAAPQVLGSVEIESVVQ